MSENYVATVKSCEQEKVGSDVYVLELDLKDPSFTSGAGQFVVLNSMSDRSVMPRPFTIVKNETGVITLLIKVVGLNTKAYSLLKKNDEIKVLGPRGSIIEIGQEVEHCIYLGGGIGAVALISTVEEIASQGRKQTVLLGAKDEIQISGLKYFKELGVDVHWITEKGSERVGLVTDMLIEILSSGKLFERIKVIACGPKQMLKSVAKICEEFNQDCIVMLEEIMACGMGSCLGCAVLGKDESIKHVCKDGPGIDAKFIDWEKFIQTPTIEFTREVELSDEIMKVRLGDIDLDYPTLNSSGCLSLQTIEENIFDISKLGGLVTKGVTVFGRPGNEMPRTCETPAGMMNSIGLENVGIRVFVEKNLTKWLSFGKPVFVNICGFTVDDYDILTVNLDDTDIDGLVVNISCPNIKLGGITFGTKPISAFAVISAVRRRTNKHLMVKLTPNVTDIVEIAKAVVDAGADSVSLVNTFLAMAIDPYTRKSKIKAGYAGLSGPAIRPIAVRMVNQIYQADLGVPIIGMGGVEKAEDAAEFLIAGAKLIAVGTGGFNNRQIFSEIHNGLKKIIIHNNFSSIDQLTGSYIPG